MSTQNFNFKRTDDTCKDNRRWIQSGGILNEKRTHGVELITAIQNCNAYVGLLNKMDGQYEKKQKI